MFASLFVTNPSAEFLPLAKPGTFSIKTTFGRNFSINTANECKHAARGSDKPCLPSARHCAALEKG
jgi:hypothetical protein